MLRWHSYHVCVRARPLSTVSGIFGGWRRRRPAPAMPAGSFALSRFSSSAPETIAEPVAADNSQETKGETSTPMSFTELGVSSILVEALKLAGFSEPTSIQKHALPLLLNKQHLSAIERFSDDRETNEETLDDASTLEQKQKQKQEEHQEPDAVLAAETGSGKVG